MRLILPFILVAAAILAVSLSVDFDSVARWAAEQQRSFQNHMATAIRALRSGDAGAVAALLAAAGAYGFVHAVGPGHGKYLIGGVGLGTSVSATRLLGIALVSSLMQALWAIALVYGGFLLLEVSARQMTTLAEDILAPASYLAIAAVGLILVWRGGRALIRRNAPEPSHHHAEHDCGCHSHGPSPDQVARLASWREAAVLVASIAIRPCTGAIFLLVIAWQMDIRLAGAAAVVVMGMGTAALTSIVAVSSTAARGLTFASAGGRGMSLAVPALQIAAGAAIAWISMVTLSLSL
ncbi:nickel/cobalt transporter [Pontivivens ytuae]|uniref:Nickel/cobalt efflux system n=1 Tax=Pontivivens ytuae TaxID=2789856 RepID=A0A7S9LVB7_9RHOB|nr:hypothetical protein [Pontivivens ytuae]QPH55997.1 hypothetical protein I0K15_09820 [Pontivivens ytuae]